MNEVEVIKQFLDSHKVHVSAEWLEHCIDWCKQELPPNHDIKYLKEKVFEQWLLLDLRDAEVACLPPNLSSKQKFALNGSYFLQVMEVVDISKPKYWQIQRIRNETAKNLEHEAMDSKRVLMLTLTDGVQEVKAIELKPIPFINFNLHPGTKIKLMGNIIVRQGRLMLEEHNVKVIGGEVDTLLVTHAAENVLARNLNLPLNANPGRIQEIVLTVTPQNANSGISDHTQNYSTNISNNPRGITKSLPNKINNTNLQNECSTDMPSRKRHSNDSLDYMNEILENEDQINEEIEMIMQLEAEREQVNTNKQGNRLKSPDMFGDFEVDNLNLESIEIPTKTAHVSERNTIKTMDNINLTESLEGDMEVFENIEIDCQKTDIKKVSSNNIINNVTKDDLKLKDNASCIKNKSPVKIPLQTKVWAIQTLHNNLPKITNGKFKIKAKFKAIVEKLTLIDEKFHLVIEVEDSSANISLKVDNEIVAHMAECTAENLLFLKSQIHDNILVAQTKALGVLKTLQENLIKLDNIMDIKIESNQKYPQLVNVL